MNLKLLVQDNISWSDIYKYKPVEGTIQSPKSMDWDVVNTESPAG